MIKTVCFILTLGLSLSVLAQTATNPNRAATNPTTTPTSATTDMTDPHIVKVLMTLNEGEIDASQMAARQAKNKDVKNFAKMMVDDHKRNTKDTKNLAKKNKIDPTDSDLSKSLKEEAQNVTQDLRKTGKENFDKEYISQVIMMHEKALTTLNNTLIPNAKNDEVKGHLEKTQASVTQHLEEAKKIQSELK